MNSARRQDSWDGVSPSNSNTSNQGFFASSAAGTMRSVVSGGTIYQAVNPAKDDKEQAQETFEVELLNDLEGVPEKPSTVSGTEFDYNPANDKWMGNIWAEPNRAVVMSYFCVGFAMRFLNTPVAYYTVEELGASPAQQSVMLTLGTLPWSFKLVYGFISDNFPIRGMRRKPYFVMGWAVYVLINIYTALAKTLSIQLLAGGAFFSCTAFMFSDVATDAILIERSKREPVGTRGSMQAIGYSVRFAGSLLGSVAGMMLYNRERWGWGLSIRQLFFINGVFPVLFIGPWVLHLRETSVTRAGEISVKQRLHDQSLEVFQALEQKAVYGPMSAVFLYGVFQVPNAAWRSFLVNGLNFTPFDLGALAVVGSLMASLGLLVYKQYLFHSSWRKLYVWTTLIVTFFSAFQIILILRINKAFGINDMVFSVGDDCIADFVSSIQFLPIVQMYISMCPDGAEGTTYAILTTMSNVAGAAAYNAGTLMTKIWDVSNETLSAGDFSGMWKLTLLTSLIQPVPLVFIGLIPKNQTEQRALQASGIRNRWGGIGLLTVLFGSLFWTARLSIKELAG